MATQKPGRKVSKASYAAVVLLLSLMPWGVLAAPFWQDSSDITALLQQHRARPSDWSLCNQIAIAYTQAQQFENAAAFYRKVLALNPSFVPARKNLGVVLWFMNRRAEAEKIFASLTAAIPNDAVPHLYLGLAHYERREFPKAKLHLSKAGDLALENPEVLPAVVDSWLSLNDSTILAHAIGFSARSNDVTATQLAAVLNRHGQYQATVRVLENRSSLDAGGFSLLAEAWDKQGQPERAFALLAKMIDAHPDQEQGYTTLAAFASAHQNDPYALKVLEQGLARHPGSAVLLIQRGLLLAIRGDREPAKESLRAAAAAKPDWTLPLIALAILDLEEGRPAQAVEALRRAITVAPGDAQGYYFCAMALNRSGEPDQAITMLRKALTIAPDNAQARVLLGQLLITQGSLRQGVGELEAVIKSDRKNARALYQLALAYRKLGQPALSEKYMSEFKALKKDLDDEKALVQILKVVQ